MRTARAVLATGATTTAVIALVTGCASASPTGDPVTPAAGTSAAASVGTPATAPPPASASPAATSVPVAATSPASAVSSPIAPVPSPSTPAPSPKTPSPTKPAPVLHKVDDAANGTTQQVRVGDTVRVTLHSTYWQMDPPSTAALTVSGSAVAGSPPGPGNVPGSGAGTVVTSYLVVHSGTAKISAQRTTCGEALLCPPNMRSYVVTLSITAG